MRIISLLAGKRGVKNPADVQHKGIDYKMDHAVDYNHQNVYGIS